MAGNDDNHKEIEDSVRETGDEHDKRRFELRVKFSKDSE